MARQATAATTVTELQTQLDTFVEYYNHRRPHRGIGRRTPATAWAARPRATPTRQGIRISEQFRVRKDRVDRDGKLTLRHGSRLHHIGIGIRWASTPVLMLIRELDIQCFRRSKGMLVSSRAGPYRHDRLSSMTSS